MKESHKEALLSASVGGVLVIVYLSIASFLDRFMSDNLSNMLGLIIDYLLNLFAQQYIFYGKITFQKDLMWRFFMGNGAALIATQVIFIYGRDYYEELFDDINEYTHIDPKYKLTIWRYLSNVLTFFIITFPLRKYYIFTKK